MEARKKKRGQERHSVYPWSIGFQNLKRISSSRNKLGKY
jgi:hypothetical protein